MKVSISHKLKKKKQFGILKNLKEVVILLKQRESNKNIVSFLKVKTLKLKLTSSDK